MRRMFRRPAPATVIACLALFVALGGTSFAAFVVTGKNVKNGSLTGKDVKDNSLGSADVQGIRGRDVKNNAIGGNQINESSLGQVNAAKQADHATNADNADNAAKLGGAPADSFAQQGQWALIQGTATDATVLASSPGIAANRLATGLYNVDIGQSAVRRPLTATVNEGTLGQVNVAPCGGNANNPGGVNCGGVNDNTHVLVAHGRPSPATRPRRPHVLPGHRPLNFRAPAAAV